MGKLPHIRHFGELASGQVVVHRDRNRRSEYIQRVVQIIQLNRGRAAGWHDCDFDAANPLQLPRLQTIADIAKVNEAYPFDDKAVHRVVARL